MVRVRVALVLAAALATAPAWADYRDSFRKGVEALDRRDWAAAASLMRQARQEHPEEGERIRIVGMRFEVYLPAFYLGVALFQSGDCAGALEAFDASAAQGAVGRTGEMARLESMRNECRPKVAAAAPTPTGAVAPTRPTGPSPALVEAQRRGEEELRKAAEAADAVAALRANPQLAPVWRPELSSRADQAALALAAARGRYEAARGKGDLAELQAVSGQAGAAQRELVAIRAEVEARRAEVLATKPAIVAERATPVPTPAPTRPGAPTPAAIAAAASAPAEVRAAAGSFLAGDYRATLATLSGASFPDARANAAAALLRAAAGHALFMAGGSVDSGLLARASTDAALCRRLAPSLAPDRRAFSPAFAEFFRQSR